MKQNWHVARNSNDSQGLVIDENTSANIAVTYDAKDAPLVAAAPEMLEALIKAEQRIDQLCKMVCWISGNPHKARAIDFNEEITAAIQKAKGE